MLSTTSAVARLSPFKLFEGFTPDELNRAAMQIDERVARAHEVLTRQGEMPAFLYLIESGEVLVEGQDTGTGRVVVRRLAGPGDMIGRRAVADNVRHQATATVQKEARLLTISMRNLGLLLTMFPVLGERLKRTEVINRLLAMPLFAAFDPQELGMVADLVRVVSYLPGQTIFRQGDLSDAMYVIDTGQVIETVLASTGAAGSWPKYLAAGNFFGRAGLVQNAPRRASAQAATHTRLFQIGRDDLAWLLHFKPQLKDALRRPDMVSRLGGTILFSRLTLDELKRLSGYTGLAHYRPNSTILRQGETDHTLYILYKGQALARAYDAEGRPKPPEGLVPGAVVGEHSLFLDEPQSVTVTSPVPSDWMYLSRDDLYRFLAELPDVRPRLQLGASVRQRQRLKRYMWVDPDEQLLFRYRRHWFALAQGIAAPSVLLLIGLLLAMLPTTRDRLLLMLLGGLVAAGGAAWALWALLDWLNDYYVLTTKRVVHIEKVILISSSREEIPLDKVQNINLFQNAAGTYLGFGGLIIETAASFGGARIRFNYITDPSGVQEQIFEAMSRVRAGKRQEAQRLIRDRLSARMGGGNQPYVPAVATSPYADAPTPASGILWRTGLGRVPIPDLFWIEHKTPEQVTWRKHWIRLLARVWMPSLVILAVVLALIGTVVAGGSLSGPLLIVSMILLAAFGLWWWWGWANWGNDLYIATNDRLIDIERLPLGLRKQRTETTFEKVQNVSFDIPHPIATILNYGSVIIHTAGAQGQLTFQYVRDPSGVQAEVFRRLTAYNEVRRQRDQEERWADLPEWFATFAEMRRGNQP